MGGPVIAPWRCGERGAGGGWMVNGWKLKLSLLFATNGSARQLQPSAETSDPAWGGALHYHLPAINVPAQSVAAMPELDARRRPASPSHLADSLHPVQVATFLLSSGARHRAGRRPLPPMHQRRLTSGRGDPAHDDGESLKFGRKPARQRRGVRPWELAISYQIISARTGCQPRPVSWMRLCSRTQASAVRCSMPFLAPPQAMVACACICSQHAR